MPFNTPQGKSTDYNVRASLIKDKTNEFIISVFHHDTPIAAEVVDGINNALVATRRLAEEYNCDYQFSNFPKK